MINLDEKEILSLYFLLADEKGLNKTLESLLFKLEKNIFEIFTVREIEDLRKKYNDKETI